MTPEEHYDRVCKPVLTELKDESKQMRKDVAAIREKVFNGFGTKINIQFWLIGVILVSILGLFVRSFV